MKDAPLNWPAAARSSNAAGEASADFERECVDFFAEVVQVAGVAKSVGQIYGVLYASPGPLSFSDIVERLQVSKGSASQGLRLLRSLGAINVARPPLLTQCPHGVGAEAETLRRDYYEPELSLRKLVGGVLRERVAPLAATGADRLARLRGLVKANGKGKNFYLDRIKQLETWQRRLKTVLPVLGMMLGSKHRGK
jgi:HTH-type transcriptional regulator, glycine betaine synthesis regulator